MEGPQNSARNTSLDEKYYLLVNIIESYDIQLIKAFYAFPQFNKKYSFRLPNGTHQFNANWQVMMVAFVFLGGFITITFNAHSIPMLFGSELLYALTWGIFAAAALTYAAEVVPTSLRGYIHRNKSDWSFRIPFAIQWSLWYLARKGRNDEAKKSLDRFVATPRNVINTKHTFSMIHHTIELERSIKVGGSYLDCLKGTNLRRIDIATVLWAFQILSGFAIQKYTTYFFTLAGLSSENSFDMSMGTFGMAFVGTCLSWGLICMLPTMWIVAGLEWVQAAMLMIWFFIYAFRTHNRSHTYVIAFKVGAIELRSKTIAPSRNVYYILSIVNSGISPYMLNPSKWGLKGKAAFSGAVFTVCLMVWTYSRLPETKGLTLATLDHLFHEKVSARRFRGEAKRFQ
ncbi:hypothetical protein BU25DRAFT_427934 [Macroventuria anomochaeta]|uniref:Uncharacterized protein n=1 Tax=Macroventuria anomochaeta TaxID=301207 RepID=A0ACB6SD66_9PLEO|nr:uncharacterized protein BU25DRAFT_427934 [Macroventuria anomochaeta]KAF2631984.1 hypothetical protein BU25DRAFT_427934 [Macroventuria anomochaeta]